MSDLQRELLDRLWRSIGHVAADEAATPAGASQAVAGLDRSPANLSPEVGEGAVVLSGPAAALPAAFDVTALAVASVAAANVAAAQLLAARNGGPVPRVLLDSRSAAAAFAAESRQEAVGWTLPPVWDPIAGNYRTRDGWIRLHTNYANHRRAVERVLAADVLAADVLAADVLAADTRDAVAAAALDWTTTELESAVVAAGGAAAAMHRRQEWEASPPGLAARSAVPVSVTDRGERPQPGAARPRPRLGSSAPALGPAAQPFEGVRVLDLTRVIAGPVATRFLAGHGADVLRIDPPGFDEVPVLLPETTLGKHVAALDLSHDQARNDFETLLGQADVLVTGLRADALARLGYDDERLAALNPGLIVARLNAYGWTGPWRDRRGFDSLVQLSCGLAAASAEAAGRDEPVALPVQALDHATGWLLAAAIGRALLRRSREGRVTHLHASLIGTANVLFGLPASLESSAEPESLQVRESLSQPALEDGNTAWGPVRRVPLAGQIEGVRVEWAVEAGLLGRHAAAFTSP